MKKSLISQDILNQYVQEKQNNISSHKVKGEFEFVLIFTKSITDAQLQSVEANLRSNSFYTAQYRNLQMNRILLFIKLLNPMQALQQAEELKLFKRLNLFDRHSQKVIQKHINDGLEKELNQVDPRILQYQRVRRFTIENRNRFILNQELYDRLSSTHQLLPQDLEEYVNIFTPAERLKITYNFLFTIRIGDLHMINYLRQEGYLRHIRALHTDDVISFETDQIQKYFGLNVSVYFEFISFYQEMLMLPTVYALFLTAYEYLFNEKWIIADGHQLSSASFNYSIFIMIWTTYVNLQWRRRQSELQIKWGVYAESKRNKTIDFNQYFKGSQKMNLITGKVEQKYSSHQRMFQYVLSALEALPMLLLAGVIKLVIFNINGLIKHPKSIMYLPTFASLNQPGGILYNIPYISTILDLLTIYTVFKINLAYTKLSKKSTKRENHKSMVNFNDSLIVKRFIFELINRFMHLWYIAFVEFDIATLKVLMSKLFVIDEIRKVVTETLLPLVMKKRLEKVSQSSQDIDVQGRLIELNLWEYDDFDDYIEVIFQYGYIILFAAIFPLAAPLSFLFNWLEIYSDKFKLCSKLYQRSTPHFVNGIGKWQLVLSALSVISVYSNLSFLIFSYFNMFENCDIEIYYHREHDCNWEKLAIYIFLLEHLILGVKFSLARYVNPKPKWVRIFLKRMRSKGHI